MRIYQVSTQHKETRDAPSRAQLITLALTSSLSPTLGNLKKTNFRNKTNKIGKTRGFKSCYDSNLRANNSLSNPNEIACRRRRSRQAHTHEASQHACQKCQDDRLISRKGHTHTHTYTLLGILNKQTDRQFAWQNQTGGRDVLVLGKPTLTATTHTHTHTTIELIITLVTSTTLLFQ